MPRRKNTDKDVFCFINMHGGDINVCWEWKGKFNNKDNRPYFTVNGKRRPAYAVVLEVFSGTVQEQGMVARHSCDNGEQPIGCCNPHHLGWGTHQDNMNDMKDRERHGVPKTVKRAIKKLLLEGRSHQEIATLYGLSREAVTKINKEEL